MSCTTCSALFQYTLALSIEEQYNKAMTRDKVLVLVDRDEAHGVSHETQTRLLSELFSLSDASQSIVHGNTWRTKYYDAPYDLYVDTHAGTLQEWLGEFNGEQCRELRDALAGVVIVGGSWDASAAATLPTEDMFALWIDCTGELNETEIDEANAMLSTSGSTLEVVQLTAEGSEANEFGEAVGLARAREVIDTHPWQGMVRRDSNQLNTSHDRNEDIGALVSLLNEARQRYASLEASGSSEARELAEATAEDIARKLGL